MMYIGEFLNGKLLGKLNKTLVVLAVLFGMTVVALAIGGMMEGGKISSMKEEIANKSKAIAEAQAAEKEAKDKPVTEKIPKGLAAVGAFQTKLQKLVSTNGCALTQFQASDQMNPFISTFSAATEPSGTWTQVEVKMNLQGTTRGVIGTLKDIAKLGVPYEFTSLELSRTQASATGEATVSANVSLRVLTIPGGA